MQKDEFYMKRCLQLAAMGKSTTAPNPMVGSVIVYQGKIIGEGYHTAYGLPHAEVEAIASVKNQELLKESTIYVNLEPCSHYGKTPPCASLIIQKQIPRVVIGTYDPFPAVSGNGVRMLQEAGINVTVGLLEAECRELNHSFFCYLEKKRPYVVLKWAQTKDGFIDKVRDEHAIAAPTPISGTLSQMMVHKLRSEIQSILVGTNTAINDNPSLTVRNWKGRNPLRLVIDRSDKIPLDYKLFVDGIPTVVYHYGGPLKQNSVEYVSLDSSKEILEQVLEDLYRRKVQSVLVEGGCFVLQKFIDSNFWDEAQVEISDVVFGNGISAPVLNSLEEFSYKVGCSNMQLFKNSHT